MRLSKTVRSIRFWWAISDARRDKGLKTPAEIKRYDNISYGPHGKANLLDIYVPKTATKLLPTIVNVHGGGWVYGKKEIYQFYCMELAKRGFTVVNINYRLAPENRFPSAVEDVNAAMTFICNKGADYLADKNNIIMVGDSAGAQIVSHYATVVTNKEFAGLFKFTVPDIKLRALGLNCGAYDVKTDILENPKDNECLLEYVDGINKPVDNKILEQIDSYKYMNENYPPSYVMSAVNDFLLPKAEPMSQHLKELGVPFELKIYGSKEREDIAHVFHVNCKLEEARICNDEECAFFRKYIV